MAERVADLTGADLRLQLRHIKTSVAHGYRFARHNGWNCGHWHQTMPQAAECIELKHWKP